MGVDAGHTPVESEEKVVVIVEGAVPADVQLAAVEDRQVGVAAS